MNLDVDFDVRVISGVDKASSEAGQMERVRAYPPKRRGVSAIRHWPPNCGPRRDELVAGSGGETTTMVTVGESLLEEEEEPEECDCCEFEDGEEDDGGGGRRQDSGGNIDDGEKVRRSLL
ncbi:unnamed protein product [Linum trigynum]|uniref:Uncharacterized protein n=1 Tax=Linum trigynum TaxID=586398 RepID=A0AAV2ET45_9ROSI